MTYRASKYAGRPGTPSMLTVTLPVVVLDGGVPEYSGMKAIAAFWKFVSSMREVLSMVSRVVWRAGVAAPVRLSFCPEGMGLSTKDEVVS